MLKNFLNKIKETFQAKDKRNRFILILGLLLLVIYLASFAAPQVYLAADIQEVTEKDFQIFLENDVGIPIEKKTRENCRFLTVDLEIKKPLFLTRNRNVEYENLGGYLMEQQYMNNTEREFKLLGSYSFTDGGYHTVDGIDIYSEDMTDTKLYDFFGNYRIELSWIDLLGRKHNQYYYLKDYYK